MKDAALVGVKETSNKHWLEAVTTCPEQLSLEMVYPAGTVMAPNVTDVAFSFVSE